MSDLDNKFFVEWGELRGDVRAIRDIVEAQQKDIKANELRLRDLEKNSTRHATIAALGGSVITGTIMLVLRKVGIV